MREWQSLPHRRQVWNVAAWSMEQDLLRAALFSFRWSVRSCSACLVPQCTAALQSFKNVRYSTINGENKYKSKDHLFIYFQNNNNGKQMWKRLSLSSFFISLILSFSLTRLYLLFSLLFVSILSYLSGTCTFFFADISGRNFLSSFEHFWAELFSQVGEGGCTCTQCPPPPPILCTRLDLQFQGETESRH